MKVRVVNKSNHDLTDLTKLTNKFLPFAQKTIPPLTYIFPEVKKQSNYL